MWKTLQITLTLYTLLLLFAVQSGRKEGKEGRVLLSGWTLSPRCKCVCMVVCLVLINLVHDDYIEKSMRCSTEHNKKNLSMFTKCVNQAGNYV